MKLMRAPLFSAAILASFFAGCGDDDDDDGVVIAEWSLGGRLDGNDCDRLGADLFEAVFFTQNDVVAAEVEEPCKAFTAEFLLPEGTYDVATRLITFDQRAVSSTLLFDDVRVDRDVGAVLHADFPESPTP